jgi:hypothetical protein
VGPRPTRPTHLQVQESAVKGGAGSRDDHPAGAYLYPMTLRTRSHGTPPGDPPHGRPSPGRQGSTSTSRQSGITPRARCSPKASTSGTPPQGSATLPGRDQRNREHLVRYPPERPGLARRPGNRDPAKRRHPTDPALMEVLAAAAAARAACYDTGNAAVSPSYPCPARGPDLRGPAPDWRRPCCTRRPCASPDAPGCS